MQIIISSDKKEVSFKMTPEEAIGIVAAVEFTAREVTHKLPEKKMLEQVHDKFVEAFGAPGSTVDFG